MTPKIGKTQPIQNALYVIATPIGHLQDITLRALDALENVDILACEDCRTTQKLLNAYNIKTKTIPYHDHNGDTMRPKIMDMLAQGHSVGLVSDAGTPLISDPGFKLVRDAINQNHRVIPLPGASAPLTALCGSGLPSDSFTFAGFLSPKSKARQKQLLSYQDYNHTIIFFESPSRLCSTLQDIQNTLGNRPVVVARELTKLYEEFKGDDLTTLIQHYTTHKPKGEIVILMGASNNNDTDHNIDELLEKTLIDHRVKEASAIVAEITGKSKKEIYQRALKIKV